MPLRILRDLIDNSDCYIAMLPLRILRDLMGNSDCCLEFITNLIPPRLLVTTPTRHTMAMCIDDGSIVIESLTPVSGLTVHRRIDLAQPDSLELAVACALGGP